MTASKGAKGAASESWDDFWAEVSGARTEVIRGVTVQVPRDVPFGFQERLNELSSSSAREDVAELVERLFGAEIFEQWEEANMGLRELLTALTWGMAQAAGTDMAFREAYDLVQQGEQGKAPAPNRQARRAASRAPSASTGGQSKRTSSASTVSARKTSRA